MLCKQSFKGPVRNHKKCKQVAVGQLRFPWQSFVWHIEPTARFPLWCCFPFRCCLRLHWFFLAFLLRIWLKTEAGPAVIWVRRIGRALSGAWLRLDIFASPLDFFLLAYQLGRCKVRAGWGNAVKFQYKSVCPWKSFSAGKLKTRWDVTSILRWWSDMLLHDYNKHILSNSLEPDACLSELQDMRGSSKKLALTS